MHFLREVPQVRAAPAAHGEILMPLFSVSRREDGGPEWRASDWPVTDGLNHGRACPSCHATVQKGARWRAHWAWHRARDARLEVMHEQLIKLSEAVKILSEDAGYDWYPALEGGGEDQEEAGGEAPLTGYIIGNGELPAETRGGGE